MGPTQYRGVTLLRKLAMHSIVIVLMLVIILAGVLTLVVHGIETLVIISLGLIFLGASGRRTRH